MHYERRISLLDRFSQLKAIVVLSSHLSPVDPDVREDEGVPHRVPHLHGPFAHQQVVVETLGALVYKCIG